MIFYGYCQKMGVPYVGLASSPGQLMTGREKMASNCARGDLGWTVGGISSQKG